MAKKFDIENAAANSLEDILELINKAFSKYFNVSIARREANLERERMEDLQKFMDSKALGNQDSIGRKRRGVRQYLDNNDESKVLVQVTGLNQKELRNIFRACGIELTEKKDSGDKTTYLVLSEDELQLLRIKAEELNSGKIKMSDLIRQGDIREDIMSFDTLNDELDSLKKQIDNLPEFEKATLDFKINHAIEYLQNHRNEVSSIDENSIWLSKVRNELNNIIDEAQQLQSLDPENTKYEKIIENAKHCIDIIDNLHIEKDVEKEISDPEQEHELGESEEKEEEKAEDEKESEIEEEKEEDSIENEEDTKQRSEKKESSQKEKQSSQAQEQNYDSTTEDFETKKTKDDFILGSGFSDVTAEVVSATKEQAPEIDETVEKVSESEPEITPIGKSKAERSTEKHKAAPEKIIDSDSQLFDDNIVVKEAHGEPEHKIGTGSEEYFEEQGSERSIKQPEKQVSEQTVEHEVESAEQWIKREERGEHDLAESFAATVGVSEVEPGAAKEDIQFQDDATKDDVLSDHESEVSVEDTEGFIDDKNVQNISHDTTQNIAFDATYETQENVPELTEEEHQSEKNLNTEETRTKSAEFTELVYSKEYQVLDADGLEEASHGAVKNNDEILITKREQQTEALEREIGEIVVTDKASAVREITQESEQKASEQGVKGQNNDFTMSDGGIIAEKQVQEPQKAISLEDTGSDTKNVTIPKDESVFKNKEKELNEAGPTGTVEEWNAELYPEFEITDKTNALIDTDFNQETYKVFEQESRATDGLDGGKKTIEGEERDTVEIVDVNKDIVVQKHESQDLKGISQDVNAQDNSFIQSDGDIFTTKGNHPSKEETPSITPTIKKAVEPLHEDSSLEIGEREFGHEVSGKGTSDNGSNKAFETEGGKGDIVDTDTKSVSRKIVYESTDHVTDQGSKSQNSNYSLSDNKVAADKKFSEHQETIPLEERDLYDNIGHDIAEDNIPKKAEDAIQESNGFGDNSFAVNESEMNLVGDKQRVRTKEHEYNPEIRIEENHGSINLRNKGSDENYPESESTTPNNYGSDQELYEQEQQHTYNKRGVDLQTSGTYPKKEGTQEDQSLSDGDSFLNGDGNFGDSGAYKGSGNTSQGTDYNKEIELGTRESEKVQSQENQQNLGSSLTSPEKADNELDATPAYGQSERRYDAGSYEEHDQEERDRVGNQNQNTERNREAIDNIITPKVNQQPENTDGGHYQNNGSAFSGYRESGYPSNTEGDKKNIAYSPSSGTNREYGETKHPAGKSNENSFVTEGGDLGKVSPAGQSYEYVYGEKEEQRIFAHYNDKGTSPVFQPAETSIYRTDEQSKVNYRKEIEQQQEILTRYAALKEKAETATIVHKGNGKDALKALAATNTSASTIKPEYPTENITKSVNAGQNTDSFNVQVNDKFDTAHDDFIMQDHLKDTGVGYQDSFPIDNHKERFGANLPVDPESTEKFGGFGGFDGSNDLNDPNKPNNPSTPEGWNFDENPYDIQINETRLVNSSFREKDTGLEEKSGEIIVGGFTGFKDSTTYRGFEFIRDGFQSANIHSYQKAAKLAAAHNLQRLRDIDANNGFKNLNLMLAEKHVNGVFDRDTTGILKNGLRFDSAENARASIFVTLNWLQAKGLTKLRDEGLGSESMNQRVHHLMDWDTHQFDILYRNGQYDELSRILGFGANIPEVTRIASIDKINILVQQARLEKLANQKYKQRRAKLFNNLTRSNLQDSAIYRGFNQIKKTVNMVKKTFHMASMIKIGTKSITYSRPVGFIRRNVHSKIVTPVLNKSEFGQKILNKETLPQRANTKVKGWKQERTDRKNKRIADKQQSKNDRRESRIKRINDRKQRRRDRSVAILSRLPGGKTLVRIGGRISNAVARVNIFRGKVANIKMVIAEALNKLKKILYKYIAIAVGVIFILQIFITAVVSSVTNITSFFDGFASDDGTAIESSSEKLIGRLQELETQWANGLQSIDGDTSFDLNSIYYTDSYESLLTYLNSHSKLSYSNGKILSPYPFGLSTGDESLRKEFSYVDGGVEITFAGANGNSGRTSNIKEIICLAATYFGNEDNLKEYGDAVYGSLSSEENALVALKNSTNTMQDWIGTSTTDYWNKKDTYQVMESYSTLLFAGSHQESFSLEYTVLPVKKQYEGLDVTPEEICDTSINDGNGCMTYDHFYYEDYNICVNGINVSDSVTPADDDNCCSHDISSFKAAFANTPDCYSVTSSSSYGSRYETGRVWVRFVNPPKTEETEESTTVLNDIGTLYASAATVDEAFNSAIKSYCNSHSIPYDSDDVSVSSDGNGGYYVVVDVEESAKIETEEVIVRDYTNSSNDSVWDVDYAYDKTTSLHITHSCNHNHKGYYCGGHLKMYVDAIVYGIADEQLGAEDADSGKVISKVEGEYVKIDTDTILVDAAEVKSAADIFDIDAAITRPYEPEEWNGWNEDNIDLAIIRYNMDWQELYDITFSTALGGDSLTQAEIEFILNYIAEKYPDTSQERLDIIREALGRCGHIGYSQTHHLCPLDGPCIYNGNSACHLSDCSGFVSNLWRSRYNGQIFTTATFWSTYRGTSSWSTFNESTAMPGDILLHYCGGGPGGGDDHALLYLGKIKIDDGIGFEKHYSIDCSTVGGVGNVFLRTRSYYDECYVVKPD